MPKGPKIRRGGRFRPGAPASDKRAQSRGGIRPSFAGNFLALWSEGAGMPGARCAR